MSRRGSILLLVIMLSFLMVSCGPQIQTTVQTGGPTAGEVIRYQGPKARIAVARFDCKAAKCTGAIGDGVADMLSTALFKTGRFIVLERGEGLREIQKELRLGQSGYVNQRQAPEMGLMEGADILVIGSITAFEPEASGIGGGGIVVPFGVPLIGGAVVKKKEAYIAADIRLVDVRTGRIINATTVEGKASSWKAGGGAGFVLGTVALAGGLGGYRNTPMEKAVRVMLESAINEIAKLVPENYYRYSAEGTPVQGTNAPAPQPQGSPSAEIRGGATGGAIIGGGGFRPGKEVVFSEDFSGYEIGDIPGSLTVKRGQVEVAEYSGKKWLRFLSNGLVVRRVDLTRDFSIQFKVFKPKGFPYIHLKLGTNESSPDDFGWGTDMFWKGNRLTAYQAKPGTVHTFAVTQKKGRIRIYVDGHMVVNEPAVTPVGRTVPNRDGFLFKTDYVNVSAGEEVLISDIKVAYY